MQRSNKIKLSRESYDFECNFKGNWNGLSFTLVHKGYKKDGEFIEIVEIIWDGVIPPKSDIKYIEQGIKELFKKQE